VGLVLVLEHHPVVHAVLQAVLLRNGFTVEVTVTADDALAFYDRSGGAVDLLIADVHLPAGSGTDVAVELSQRCPRVPILFTSGTDIEFWSEADAANVAKLPRGSYAFLAKPFTCWTLMRKIGELLPPFTLPRTA